MISEADEETYDRLLHMRLGILDVLRRIKKGESKESIARDYVNPKVDISSTVNNQVFISKHILCVEPDDNIFTLQVNEKQGLIEDAVYLWIMHIKYKNQPVYPQSVCEKATQYNEQTVKLANFVANKAWLRHFKARHGIKEFYKPRMSLPDKKSSKGEIKHSERKIVSKKFDDILQFFYGRIESTDDLFRCLEESKDWEDMKEKIDTIRSIIN